MTSLPKSLPEATLPDQPADKPIAPRDPLPRIAALTTNARNTYFTLLAAMLFVGITLMGVKHIDFYGVGRATQLPLISVSVPTYLFFYAAPPLVAALYSYFHLYLIRLWESLGTAPAKIEGEPLGRRVTPWLITDAALLVRDWRRDDGCRDPRVLELPAAILNIALGWGLGPAVLIYSWQQSLPARDIWMTLCSTGSLIAVAIAGISSAVDMRQRMRGNSRSDILSFWDYPAPALAMTAAALWALHMSQVRTISPDAGNLAPINLAGAELTGRPSDWQSYSLARKRYRAEWCRRADVQDCTTLSDEQHDELETDWETHRSALIRALVKPDLAGRDLRGADLTEAFIVGTNLTEANLSGATILTGADLEAANLFGATLSDATLWATQLQEADLTRARMQGADLGNAQMQGAILVSAHMPGADLTKANLRDVILAQAEMRGAILAEAQLQGAKLNWAQLQGANLSQANLQGADLRKTQLQEANLREVKAQGADLREAQLQGALFNRANFQDADFRHANLADGLFRSVDLRRADLREANLKGAFLQSAKLQSSNLRQTRLQGAIFSWAHMKDVDLSKSQLQGAHFDDAQLQNARFWRAQMQGAILRNANLQNASLAEAHLQDTSFRRSNLQGAFLGETLMRETRLAHANLRGTNLEFTYWTGPESWEGIFEALDLGASRIHGGALRSLNLRDNKIRTDSHTDFRNAFLDASVELPLQFFERQGKPCQWEMKRVLDDTEFFGRWRGWLDHDYDDLPEREWSEIAPEGFEDVPKIRPPDDCEWKIGPWPPQPR